MPPRKRDRLHQVHRWLVAHFPPAYKTELRVEQLGPSHRYPQPQGDTYRLGNRIIIRIDKRLPWHVALDTLIHEYAHAYIWETPAVEEEREHHGPEWGVAYARVYRAFYDEEGWRESRDF